MNVTINNNLITACISDLGAELQSINYENYELLWQGDKSIWESRSPLLFPIVGRLKNDELKFNGNTYNLSKHGFAKDLKFELFEKEQDAVTFLLSSSDMTKKMFPFDFNLFAQYRLNNNHLKITYKVLNLSNDTMYFSIGAHPGFNCKIGDTLVFEKKETINRLVMNKDSYLCEKRPFLDNSDTINITESLFDDDALIFDGLKSDFVTLKTDKFDIKANFSPAPQLGIWAKKNAPYVCIEPWFGTDDSIDAKCDFNQKYGILSLEKNKSFTYTFDIEFIKK